MIAKVYNTVAYSTIYIIYIARMLTLCTASDTNKSVNKHNKH